MCHLILLKALGTNLSMLIEFWWCLTLIWQKTDSIQIPFSKTNFLNHQINCSKKVAQRITLILCIKLVMRYRKCRHTITKRQSKYLKKETISSSPIKMWIANFRNFSKQNLSKNKIGFWSEGPNFVNKIKNRKYVNYLTQWFFIRSTICLHQNWVLVYWILK